MKKQFFSNEKDGFYGTYYENPKGANCAMIGLFGDDPNDFMAKCGAKWLHKNGVNVMCMSPDVKNYGHVNFPLERIETSIKWLKSHGNKKIGIMGMSTAGMDSLVAASYFPDITLTFGLTPSDFVWQGFEQGEKDGCKEWPIPDASTLSWQGKPLAYMPFVYAHPEYYHKIEEETKGSGDITRSTHLFIDSEKAREHTEEEMIKVMARSGDYYSWVCTNSDFLSNTRQRERFNNSFTKQMRVFMQTFDNKYKTGEVFDTKDLLPDMEQVLGRHNCLMFSPLHFQDEVIGYAANSFSPIYFLFQNTRRFINNTNQIMESFKNRQRLERANAELARIHMLDPMTGIYNRRGFYKNVRKLISKAEKQGVGVWVFSIDMDNLKKINDLYGHNEGDKAIKAVASLMTKCTAEGGICSRFGGDEFVAVIAETDGADSFYEKVSRSIAEYNRRSKSPYDVSISCGYKAGKPKTLKEIDDLMKASDREMYTQKRKHHSRRD